MQRHSGFTLIEILIALFIFVIVISLASTGLYIIDKAHHRTRDHIKQLQQLQIAVVLIRNDISHIIDRPVKDNNGKTLAAVLGNNQQLQFTRDQVANPLMVAKRSHLVRVGYLLQHHQLVRKIWPVLDRAPSTRPSTRVLLEGVNSIKITYWDDGKFYSRWPLLHTAHKHPIPQAIQLSIHLQRLGSMTQLIATHGVGFATTQ